MRGVLLNPILLRGLWSVAMVKAARRYRNRRRRLINRHRLQFYEQAWRDTANQIGATYEPLGFGFARISRDGMSTRVGPDVCEVHNAVASDIMVNKTLTAQILAAEGLPVTRYLSFNFPDLRPALRFLQNCGRNCVVKPAKGTGGGRGVTTGVRTRWDLAKASASAAVYGNELLIEEQVSGENYRLLYLDGTLIDSFVRYSPSVVGDGRLTIAQLVRDENQQRLEQGIDLSQVLLSIDQDMRNTLASQGMTLASVPAAGKRIALKTVINENRGHDNVTATHLLCESVIRDGARAAAAVGARLAGVDIITTDPGIPLSQSEGAILEVNSPNFYYHYHKKDGACPVALYVLRALLGERPAEQFEERQLGSQVLVGSTS